MKFDKSICKKILSDIRETDSKYSKKLINQENKERWSNLETRNKIYSEKGFRPDAERWEGAIKSIIKIRPNLL